MSTKQEKTAQRGALTIMNLYHTINSMSGSRTEINQTVNMYLAYKKTSCK